MFLWQLLYVLTVPSETLLIPKSLKKVQWVTFESI